MCEIVWNPKVKLIISDVDGTVAPTYMRASTEMIHELGEILKENKVLFLISGASLKSITNRIVDFIDYPLRKKILIGACSGAEVWGYNQYGQLQAKPFNSLYESAITDLQGKKWREIINKLITDFNLEVFPTMDIETFKGQTRNPNAIMFDDRRTQITLEMVNNRNLRIPFSERALELLKKYQIPITPRLAGEFALDFAIEGVSKTTAVKYVLENNKLLAHLELDKNELRNSDTIEVWGDKFSVKDGGTDRHISEALPPEVRSITFRRENKEEFPEGYNIVIWNGTQSLDDGLLEYLKSRY